MQHHCEHCRKIVEARRAPFSNSLICSICGSEFGNGFLVSGTIVSGFRIEEEIGRGSFGVVYKALQLNLERMVALKVLSDELAQDSDFVDNFFREARLAASLSHPNIVQAFDAGATPEGIYYFAMELIEGETLESRIHRVGRMEPEAAVAIALKIARALEYAWDRQKLTHGDIKPENIILNSSGEAKLADLGLAKTAYEERTGHLMVTPLYAPPEIIGGVTDFDPVRADIYSFGGTFYHMLGGVPPFNEDDPDKVMEMHLNDVPESLAARFQINSELSFITDRMLAKNPDERPLAWREIIELLEAVDLSLPALSKSTRRKPLSPQSEKARKSNNSKIIIAAVAGVVALGGVGLVMASSHEKTPEPQKQDTAGRDTEWNKLKTDIKFLNEHKALEMVRKYVADRKDDVPVDALKTLNNLENETLQAQKRKTLIKEFDDELLELKKMLEKPDLLGYNSGDLMRIQSRLINMLKKIGDNKFLYDRMAPKDKQFLDDKVKALKDALQVNKNQEMRKQFSETDQINIKRAEGLAEGRKQSRVINAEIDNFRMAISRFLSQPERQRTAASYGQCFSSVSKKDLPGNLSQLQNFIKDIYDINKNIYTVIASSRDALAGQLFTQQDEFKDFTITDVDRNNLTLERKLDYGALKKKVAIKQLKNKVKVQLIFDLICAPVNIPRLDNEDIAVILRFLLDCNEYDKFNDMLKRQNKLTASEVQRWKNIGELFYNAADEAAMIKAWNRAIQLKDQKRSIAAYEAILQIAANSENTDFYQRYTREFERQKDYLWTTSPEIRLNEMLKQFDNAMNRKNYFPALQMIMSAETRYGAIPGIDQELRQRLNSGKDTILKIIDAQANVNADNSMTALYWKNLRPGDIRLFNLMVNNNGWLKSEPPVSDAMSLMSAWDSGNWESIRSELVKVSKTDKEFVIENSRFADCRIPLMFYCGLAAAQLDDTAMTAKAGKMLMTIADPEKNDWQSAISAGAYAAELYTILRQPQAAGKAITGMAAKDKKADSFQVGLMELYVYLQKPEISAKDFSALVRDITKIYGSNTALFNDLEWVNLADKIVKGAFVFSDFDQLGNRQPRNPDLCARLVTDAAIFAYLNEKFPTNGLKWLIETNDKLITGNASSAELWRKNTYLKLELAKDNTEIAAVLNNAIRDYRLCATNEYPSMIQMKLAIFALEENKQEFNVQQLAKEALLPCLSASEAEKTAISGISGEKPVVFIKELLSKGLYNKIFPTIATGIWLNYYQRGNAYDMLVELQDNDRILSWDERLLRKKLEAIIKE